MIAIFNITHVFAARCSGRLCNVTIRPLRGAETGLFTLSCPDKSLGTEQQSQRHSLAEPSSPGLSLPLLNPTTTGSLGLNPRGRQQDNLQN